MAISQFKLRQLQQDSATTDQVIAWNGSTWSPGSVTDLLNIPSTEIVYGTGTGVTSEAAFNYNASTNIMGVGGIDLSVGNISATSVAITLSTAVTSSSGQIKLGTGSSSGSGENVVVGINKSLTSSSGSNPRTLLKIDGSLGNTGGSTAITRSVWIVPSSLTTVTDYRGLDLDFDDANATGIRQSGAAVKNLISGATTFGSTSSPDGSAIIDIVSTTKGLGLPSMTTVQRDAISSPRDGLIVYDNTSDVLSLRANGAWVNIDPDGDGNGIYSGSGLIAAGAVASIDVNSDFAIEYSDGDAVLYASDLVGSVFIGSKDGVNRVWVQNTGISFVGDIFDFSSGTAGAEIRLLEPSGSGSNYTGFVAPALASNLVYTLPTTATDGYFLKYNSSGNQLEWAAVSGGGDGIYGGSGSIATAAVATLADDSTFTIDYFDGSNALYLVDNGESFILSSGAGYGINANSSQVQVLGPNSNYLSVTSTGPVARGGLSITSGYLKLPSDITPSQITADQNDYSPTGLDDAAVVRLSSDASRTITGIDASTKGGDGDILTLINVGSFDIVLSDNDSASTATNRMALGGTDVTLGPGFSITLIYDDTSNIWRTFSFSGGGSADGNGIYSGSGTIPASTVATLTTDEYFRIQYSNTENALDINDAGTFAILSSRNGATYLNVQDNSAALSSDVDVLLNVFNGAGISITSTYIGFTHSTSVPILRFYEDFDNGTNYISIQPPASLASTNAYTLPSSAAVGLLHNDGSNVWSWSTVSNSDLASGVGGIYKGSGNIAAGAVATVGNTSSFTINYNGGNAALTVIDNSGTLLGSDNGLKTLSVDNTGTYTDVAGTTATSVIGRDASGYISAVTVGQGMELASGSLNATQNRAINAQTGTSYTLVLSDAGKLVTLSNASAITLTIPTNASVAFPTGTVIDIAQIGAGQVTVGGASVTINSADGDKKLRVQYSSGSLIKTGTDTWLLVGDITA